MQQIKIDGYRLLGTTKKKPARGRGRPKLPPGEGKRYPLNMRTTKQLKDDLEDAARESGRSLAQEVEFRLERSLVSMPAEDLLKGITGTSLPDSWAFVISMSSTLFSLYEKYGSGREFWTNAEAIAELHFQITCLLRIVVMNLPDTKDPELYAIEIDTEEYKPEDLDKVSVGGKEAFRLIALLQQLGAYPEWEHTPAKAPSIVIAERYKRGKARQSEKDD